jgi:nicotinate-nucleotide adenylyltransferase
MKIGIFGGTFDPIHTGHLKLAHAAMEQFGLQKVLFVPALTPPHKASRSDLTPAPFRYRMVEMAIQDEPRFEISDVEFNRPGTSYTVDTLREFKKKYPHDELYLILGEDSAADIPQWREPEEIGRLARLAAARRPGYLLPSEIPGLLRIEMPECPVSSSSIREQLSRQGNAGTAVLPEKVETYIRKMKLYGAA